MSARPDPKTLDDLERTAQALLGPGVRLERAETEARCWNDLAAENERLRAENERLRAALRDYTARIVAAIGEIHEQESFKGDQ